MKKHETVRSSSRRQFRDIVSTIINVMPDPTHTEAQDIISNKGWFAYEIQQVFKRFATDIIYTRKVIVDYDRTFTEMVRACDFHKIDEYFNLNRFTVKGKGRRRNLVTAVRFNGSDEKGDRAVDEMTKRGYRPTKIEEFLAFCEAYRKPHNIMFTCLGSSYKHYAKRIVPCFCQVDGRRTLIAGVFDWTHRAFAVVPK